jgi:uncharacterized membrane protein YuzA (DUF378 family)
MAVSRTNIPRQLLDMNSPFYEVYMKKLDVLAAVLLVVGGLNWGVVGLTGSDIVGAIFGELSPASRTVYILVGLAALYQAMQWKAIQHRWQPALAE